MKQGCSVTGAEEGDSDISSHARVLYYHTIRS